MSKDQKAFLVEGSSIPTNVIEEFHRQIRKVTKTKGAFTNETALLQLIYLAVKNIEKKWSQPPRNRAKRFYSYQCFSRAG